MTGRLSRRQLLKWAGAAGTMAVTAPITSCVVQPIGGVDGTDPNSLVLPPGFTSRVIGVAGQRVEGTAHEYSMFPDGGATFVDTEVPGGWYYVANHEIPFGAGGVTSFRFAPDGTIVDAYPICVGTSMNCAGGRTPWGTWLTCEETDGGIVWECDPTRPYSQQPRAALGTFAHEAAAVAADGRIYLTEDRPDGCLYRFTPANAPDDLTEGLLEVACVGDGDTVTWRPVPDPYAIGSPTRWQVADALHFDGGEGIATAEGLVWFTTKGDDRIWQYDTTTGVLTIRYQAGGPSMLGGVDNVWATATATGQALLVAEDGDDMQVVAVLPDDTLIEVVRVVGHPGSEITGPALSPDRSRLYFSSQRAPIPGPFGPGGPTTMAGVTFEVTGPFDELLELA